MKASENVLKKTRFCPLIFTNIYSLLKPALYVMTLTYEINLLTNKSNNE